MFANHQQTRQINFFGNFYFRNKVTMSDHTPYMEMVTDGVYFQRLNDVRLSKSVAVSEKLPCQGRELTPRIYSQLRRVDHIKVAKISAVCSMLLRQNRSTFRRYTGSAARRHCVRLIVSKKFVEEKIFAATNFYYLAYVVP